MASACSDLNKGKQLQALNQLQTTIEKAEQQSKKINRKDITSIQEYFSYHLKRIGDSLEGKEIQKETAFFLDSCKFLLHEINQIQKQQQFIDTTLPLTNARINNLRYDIQEQIGNRKLYDEYIAVEAQNVNHLSSVSQSTKASSTEITALADRLARRLQELTIHFKQP